MARRSESECNICDLPDDLLMDILSRLPPKSLIDCKRVSREFGILVSTLIHSPTRPRQISGLFIVTKNQSTATEAIWYCNLRDDRNGYNLHFLPCHPATRLEDHRHGFLLCSSERPNYQLYVCNPVTRQLDTVPPPPPPPPPLNSVNFQDDDFIVTEKFCLVLDESPDVLSHYKVVQFVILSPPEIPKPESNVAVGSSKDEHDDPSEDLYVYVYSSRTGQWSESKAYIKGVDFMLLDEPCVFLYGALFLPADPSQVLLFDVEEEYCEVFKLPNDLGVKCSHCLGECEGCLCYAYHNGSEMQVLKIDRRNSNEWVLKHSINLDHIAFVDSDSETKEQLDILAFHPNLDAIFLGNSGHFFCYDFNSGASESIVNHGDFLDVLFRVFPFLECLRFLANANQNG